MEERGIHISSVNREKRGTSRPGDFTIKFNPPLKLDPEMKHELALDRLSMTYSWYNIRSDYGNNKIKINTLIMVQRGKQKLLQMECISILISMIIFISTWLKKLITQQSQMEINSINSI